jgi:hypothetical protein
MKDRYTITTKHGVKICLGPGPEGIRKKLAEVLAHELP